MNTIKIHPIYKNYGYNIEINEIIHIPSSRIVKQRTCNSGYNMLMVSDGNKQKNYSCHRFIWECCNDIIPNEYEIDHINKNKVDNDISNLRCVTIQENRKHRDHTNIVIIGSKAHQLKRFIKATNIETYTYNCFNSKCQCAKYFNISAAMVYLICEHREMYKHANTDRGIYKFEYIDENDVENVIKIPHGRLGKTYKKLADI